MPVSIQQLRSNISPKLARLYEMINDGRTAIHPVVNLFVYSYGGKYSWVAEICTLGNPNKIK